MTKTLEITTVASCPLKCSFCPQDNLIKANEGIIDRKARLSVEDFMTVLSKLPQDVRIDFSGMVECFFNRNAPAMIAIAKVCGYEVFLYTTLMGLRWNDINNELLCVGGGPDYIRIHVPDQKALVIPDATWILQHNFFLNLGLKATYMSMGPMTPWVTDYLKGLNIHVELPDMLSRASNLWLGKHIPTGRVTCAMDRYHSNVLLPNGDVVGCCMLYSREIVLGNLLTEPYQAIHDRAAMWARDKNPPADSPCRKCEWAKPI